MDVLALGCPERVLIRYRFIDFLFFLTAALAATYFIGISCTTVDLRVVIAAPAFGGEQNAQPESKFKLGLLMPTPRAASCET